jgi:hypothetical protein
MTASTVANESLRDVVNKLQDKQHGQLHVEAISQELKNARDGAEAQQKALAELKHEYGEHFQAVAALDVEALRRAGIEIDAHIESAKAWLGDLVKWGAHHGELAGWASNPNPRNLTLEAVIAKIKAGETAASTMRARAQKLSAELAKI